VSSSTLPDLGKPWSIIVVVAFLLPDMEPHVVQF